MRISDWSSDVCASDLPVARIETEGDRVTGIVTRSGFTARADLVASNADLMHSYRDLPAHPRGKREAKPLRASAGRRASSSSLWGFAAPPPKLGSASGWERWLQTVIDLGCTSP